MFAYVDESGNTGDNLFDEAQPWFDTAALITRADFDAVHGPKVAGLARKLGVKDLHANRLGVGKVEAIAEDLRAIFKAADARFFLSRVEKRYLATTKIIDTIFDAGENRAVPWHAYNLRPFRMLLVFKIAAFLLDEDLARTFWRSLMAIKEQAAADAFAAGCRQLLERVGRLPDQRSREIVSEAVRWALENPEAISVHSSSVFLRYGHLPNMVAFTNLLDGIDRQARAWSRRCRRIVHDRQMQFEQSLRRWHELITIRASGEPLHLPFGEVHVARKVPGSDFAVVSSDRSAGIQAVDVVLWLFGRLNRKQEIGPSCARLMDHVFRKTRLHDFSFDGAYARLHDQMTEIMTAPPGDAALARAREMLGTFEARRQEAMREYAAGKLAGAVSVLPQLGHSPD